MSAGIVIDSALVSTSILMMMSDESNICFFSLCGILSSSHNSRSLTWLVGMNLQYGVYQMRLLAWSGPKEFMLHEWQRLAGWINWSLNVFPLLWPTLNNFYAKIRGKCVPNKYIRINNTIHANLLWAIQHLKSSPSVCLIHHLCTMGHLISRHHLLVWCMLGWYGFLVAWQMHQLLFTCTWRDNWQADLLF